MFKALTFDQFESELLIKVLQQILPKYACQVRLDIGAVYADSNSLSDMVSFISGLRCSFLLCYILLVIHPYSSQRWFEPHCMPTSLIPYEGSLQNREGLYRWSFFLVHCKTAIAYTIRAWGMSDCVAREKGSCIGQWCCCFNSVHQASLVSRDIEWAIHCIERSWHHRHFNGVFQFCNQFRSALLDDREYSKKFSLLTQS